MSLSYFFRNPAGVITDITSRVRLYTLDVTSNAEEATVATSEVVVDDPAGDLIIGGHRLFYVTESAVASSSNTLVWIGYTADRNINRGPFQTEVGRQWRVSLVDENTLLERRILTTSSANRPAETDVARIQYVANVSALIDDTQYISTASPVQMDAVDYRGQTIAAVIDDCMQQSGKNAFCWRRQELASSADPMGSVSLWYGAGTLTAYNSDAKMSNLASDVDMVNVFAISEDTQLRRDPSRVYSGVYMQYDGGVVYEQRTVNATNFAIGGRDVTSPAQNVKTLAKATTRAQRYLVDNGTEEDVITTTAYKVPAASVNRFMAGMKIRVTATHLPGYTTGVYGRILNRNVKQVSEDFFDIRMEISVDSNDPAGDGTNTGSGAGGGGGGSGLPSCVVPVDPYSWSSMQSSFPSTNAGENSLSYTDNVGGTNHGRVLLYDLCTYSYAYTLVHGGSDHILNMRMTKVSGGALAGQENMGGYLGGPPPPPRTAASGSFALGGVSGVNAYWELTLAHTGYVGTTADGSVGNAIITYVSGPDSRFSGGCT